eukprot:128391_1
MTSILITFATYVSGNGIIALIKSIVCCQCCRTSDVDLNKTNKWKTYPQTISITCANPFKSKRAASELYGDYHLQKFQGVNAESIPIYRSATAHTRLQKHYTLQYMQQENPYYNGWIISVDDEKEYKYDMIQLNGLQEEEKSPLMRSVPLRCLDKVHQKCIFYSWEQVDLELGYWKEAEEDLFSDQLEHELLSDFDLNYRLDHSGFMNKQSAQQIKTDVQYNGMKLIPQSQFDTNAHWIRFSYLKKYYHTTWKHEVLNINGTYLLDEIIDRSDDEEFRSVTYKLKHKNDKNLFCLFIFYESGVGDRYEMGQYKWEISIKHEYLGKLAHLSFYENAMQFVYAKQFVFSDDQEITFQIEDNHGCSYYLAKFVDMIFLVMALYQLIIDFMYFVQYVRTHEISWMNYECLCYIITNSANMKQAAVFAICCAMHGSSFLYRKFTIVGKAFLLILCCYGFSMVLVAFVFAIPFIFCYPWFVIIVAFGAAWAKVNKKIDSLWMIFGMYMYFVVVLWSVESMSRLYNGQNWIESLWLPVQYRHTKNYVSHLILEYHSITQFVVWIV